MGTDVSRIKALYDICKCHMRFDSVDISFPWSEAFYSILLPDYATRSLCAMSCTNWQLSQSLLVHSLILVAVAPFTSHSPCTPTLLETCQILPEILCRQLGMRPRVSMLFQKHCKQAWPCMQCQMMSPLTRTRQPGHTHPLLDASKSHCQIVLDASHSLSNFQ